MTKKRPKKPSEELLPTDSCWFRTNGQCLLDELLERQSELERSHQRLCTVVKQTHTQGEENAKKLDAVLAALEGKPRHGK